MDKSTWKKIQKHEIQYHLQKDHQNILEINLNYWKSLLAKLEPHISIADDTRVLDMGCGGCGVLLAIDKGKLVGVDPLMMEYLKKFDFLKNSVPTWMVGTAEDLEFEEPFDIIFSINSLDHVYDPQLAAKKLDSFLRRDGYLVISLNCHNTNFFYHYYRRFYRFIDNFHPHHFRSRELFALFPGYKVIKEEDIDILHLSQRDLYREKVLKKKNAGWNSTIRILLNPFKYPMVFTRLFQKLYIHRKKPEQKSIFSTYLFVLQKEKMNPVEAEKI